MNYIPLTGSRGGLRFIKAATSLLFALLALPAFSAEGYVRIAEVSYGRADELNLTMDIFRPDRPNGIGLIDVVSGGWTSTTNMMSLGFIQAFLTRGYPTDVHYAEAEADTVEPIDGSQLFDQWPWCERRIIRVYPGSA